MILLTARAEKKVSEINLPFISRSVNWHLRNSSEGRRGTPGEGK